MTNDEIVRIKHLAAHCRKLSTGKSADGNFDFYRSLKFAADAIESLQAQLAESQRREQAAVEDWKTYEESGQCDVCKYGKGGDCTYPEGGRCKFEWRGPQEAGKEMQ